ncbi:hypothetical protein DFH06DRAFT_702889 [Mycena polygramma]|nr:hypothetical protein DFH06DRAFT_702889 [Mycena polygramma]
MIVLSEEFSKQLALEQRPRFQVRIHRCQHHCSQCDSENRSVSSPDFLHSKRRTVWARRLLYAPTYISSSICVLSVAEFCTEADRRGIQITGIAQIFVAFCSFGTFVMLALL